MNTRPGHRFPRRVTERGLDPYEEPRGYAVPNLCTRPTRAYPRLRTEPPLKGEYYRDEAEPEVYLFDGGRFVYQSALPRRATAIVAPAGMLERMREWYRQ